MSTQKANRNVKVGDRALRGMTELVIRFTCVRCGNAGERKETELYCHFPVKHPFDNPTATFALPREGFVCDDCLLEKMA